MDAHILITSDTAESAEFLAGQILSSAGYEVTIAEDVDTPPACDMILVDVTHLRGSPFAGLRAQRRQGNDAPALLYAPRLTGDMAAELFPLDIRGFIHKPAEDAEVLARLETFLSQIQQQQDEAALRHHLEQTKADMARRLEEMNALSRIGRAITALDDIDVILERIVQAASYLGRADEIIVFLIDGETNQLQLRAHSGLDDYRLDGMLNPTGSSDPEEVVQSGQPINKSGDQQGIITPNMTAATGLYVPIVANQRVVGVLAAHRHDNDQPFQPVDQAVLFNLADYAGIALNRAQIAGDTSARIDRALAAARRVKYHADTLFSPIDGIESQADTLLAGGFEPLNEAQHTAVTRIKQAANRLKEIVGHIREELAEFEDGETTG